MLEENSQESAKDTISDTDRRVGMLIANIKEGFNNTTDYNQKDGYRTLGFQLRDLSQLTGWKDTPVGEELKDEAIALFSNTPDDFDTHSIQVNKDGEILYDRAITEGHRPNEPYTMSLTTSPESCEVTLSNNKKLVYKAK